MLQAPPYNIAAMGKVFSRPIPLLTNRAEPAAVVVESQVAQSQGRSLHIIEEVLRSLIRLQSQRRRPRSQACQQNSAVSSTNLPVLWIFLPALLAANQCLLLRQSTTTASSPRRTAAPLHALGNDKSLHAYYGSIAAVVSLRKQCAKGTRQRQLMQR